MIVGFKTPTEKKRLHICFGRCVLLSTFAVSPKKLSIAQLLPARKTGPLAHSVGPREKKKETAFQRSPLTQLKGQGLKDHARKSSFRIVRIEF
jgi:hypothetical protein